jgi:hypothetical protein
MTDEELKALQKQIALNLMEKVDIYHSEKHRGVLVVSHGAALHPNNIIAKFQY